MTRILDHLESDHLESDHLESEDVTTSWRAGTEDATMDTTDTRSE